MPEIVTTGQWRKKAIAGIADHAKIKSMIAAASAVFVLIILGLTVRSVDTMHRQVCPQVQTDPVFAPERLASPPPPNNTKLAVIIENRPLTNLVPLVLAFSAVLGQQWPIRIFHSNQNALVLDTPPIQKLVDNGHVTLQLLPAEDTFTSHEPVSVFLTSPWIWEQLAPSKHVLMFQTDSMLCSNSPRTVDDFLEYDFVGAPIETDDGHNYNGGLSIRNREMMLEIAKGFEREPNSQYEDQWFADKLRAMPPKPNGQPYANLPSFEAASDFAVESIWKDKPFGIHQLSRWHGERLAELQSWCPEYQLAIEGGLHPNHKEDFALLDIGVSYGPDVEPW
ncbi:MAG: hypothetical protein Q9222_007144 [Ikaeria aurantiellina]